MVDKKKPTKKAAAVKAAKKTKKPAPKKAVAKKVAPKKVDKKTKKQKAYVPTLRSNLARSFKMLRQHKREIMRVVVIYGLLYFLFVRAITNLDLGQLRETVSLIFGNGEDTFGSRAVLAGTLFGESTNLDQSSGFYFMTIFSINSLAFIWMLRHFWADKKTSVKEAYYQGMYPIVPVVLVSLMVFLQAVPFLIGSFIMQTIFSNGLTVNIYERLGVVSIFVAGITLSVYWLIGTIIAAYAVTVPGMTPMSAFTRAKQMLKGRRFLVVRQVLLFAALSAFLAMSLMLAVIYVWPAAGIVAVTLIVIMSMPWLHFYFYGLYRDLLNEQA